ncbi:MAG TPA: hypothetical protein VMH83_11095, partial [Candidatus Acidoferrum sp.]|nr:hypothetical protein [Candidatus Acidoferrum sp.]
MRTLAKVMAGVLAAALVLVVAAAVLLFDHAPAVTSSTPLTPADIETFRALVRQAALKNPVAGSLNE